MVDDGWERLTVVPSANELPVFVGKSPPAIDGQTGGPFCFLGMDMLLMMNRPFPLKTKCGSHW